MFTFCRKSREFGTLIRAFTASRNHLTHSWLEQQPGTHSFAAHFATDAARGGLYVTPPVEFEEATGPPTGACNRLEVSLQLMPCVSTATMHVCLMHDCMHRSSFDALITFCCAALSWLRRRGPPLPESVLHRLFRKRQVSASCPDAARLRHCMCTPLLDRQRHDSPFRRWL